LLLPSYFSGWPTEWHFLYTQKPLKKLKMKWG